MTRLPVRIAGTRLDLVHDGDAPAGLGRYLPFACDEGPAEAVLELVPGHVEPALPYDGTLVVDGGAWRVRGAEAGGALDPRTGRGRVAVEPIRLLDAFVRGVVARRLAARGGLLLHAAAVVAGGAAHVAPGRSGSGKSTLADLAGEVLADELVAVEPDGAGGHLAHGTPWWRSSGGRAPLAAIYALAWDGEAVTPLPRAGFLRHLAVNTIVPLDHPEARRAAFAACGALAAAAPFRRLAFRPDTAVDTLLAGRSRRAA